MGNVSARQMLWLFLGFNGRVGQRAYFLAGLLLLIIQFFVFYRFLSAEEGSQESGFWAMLFMIAAVVSIISNLALAAKRLQDIDKPPMIALVYILAGFFMWLILCFVPGTPGPNQYGPGPDQMV